jgi:hypothetical protein
MALAAGDPAEIWDVWTRVITSEEYWTKDGRLHNSAFGGKAFRPPNNPNPWTYELSGRILSFIEHLEKESVAFCKTIQKDFAGVMYQNVENLRSDGSGFPMDVIYTPHDTDNAHSDVAVYRATDKKHIFAVRDWLQDFIQHVRSDKLAAVCALRQNMPASGE